MSDLTQVERHIGYPQCSNFIYSHTARKRHVAEHVDSPIRITFLLHMVALYQNPLIPGTVIFHHI